MNYMLKVFVIATYSVPSYITFQSDTIKIMHFSAYKIT